MSRVVVGVNGAAPARVAVHWAARAARERGLPLTIVLAVSPKTTPMTNRLMVFGVRELPHRRVARILDDAVDIVASGAGRSGPPEVTTRVVTGNPLDALVELSRDAELVVVGARRRSPWRAVRSSLGSLLVLRTRCPVAIVRDNHPAMPHPAHGPAQVIMSSWVRPA